VRIPYEEIGNNSQCEAYEQPEKRMCAQEDIVEIDGCGSTYHTVKIRDDFETLPQRHRKN